MNTRQILIIHGGSSYDTYKSYRAHLDNLIINYERLKKSDKWREWVSDAMPEADVLLPDFPNKQNAQYDEWVVFFEKLLPLLTGNVSLVGYSLGAMFLAKYLHEHPLATPVRKLLLVAPCYDDESVGDLGSFRVTSARGLEKSAQEIHLFHSEDDPVSPFAELAKFQQDVPIAKAHIFIDRNHFFQPTFPELVDVLWS